jgi:hypothetical protein
MSCIDGKLRRLEEPAAPDPPAALDGQLPRQVRSSRRSEPISAEHSHCSNTTVGEKTLVTDLGIY